jgi:hypothetical protein
LRFWGFAGMEFCMMIDGVGGGIDLIRLEQIVHNER